MRSTLKELQMAKEATHENVTAILNFDPNTIRAFEKSFFNVLDHKRDLLHLQNGGATRTRDWANSI